MIKRYYFGNSEEATKVFLNIYENSPFSFKWLDYDSIYKYFVGFENCPDFKGFIYEINGVNVGFCYGKANMNFPLKKYHINEIFIRREFQNKGIGSKFMQEIEIMLLEDKISVIEINTDRRVYAYDFYKKNGFSEANNIITMVKSIKK